MPKHRRLWNAEIHRKHVREGRGRGSGSGYQPWICVQDFASRGVVSRVKGYVTGRVHHLLSNNELAYFYILDRSELVTDIREQYPLSDLECAVEIAAKAGIKYPTDNTSGYPYILTCDFMITTKEGLKARTIKLTSELNNARTLEKLEIERRYWMKIGIDWKIVTERDIPFQKAKNIEWLYTAHGINSTDIDSEIQVYAQAMMIRLLLSGSFSIIESSQVVEQEFTLMRGMGIQLFKRLVLDRKISINLNQPLDLNARGVAA